MKRFKLLLSIIAIFILLGFNTTLKAEEIKIELSCSDDFIKNWVKDRRSITLEPTVTIDGYIIRIYSDVTVENVSIVIKDAWGNVVYSNRSISPARCHSFELFGLTEGEYVLEFEIGEDNYYGEFMIM